MHSVTCAPSLAYACLSSAVHKQTLHAGPCSLPKDKMKASLEACLPLPSEAVSGRRTRHKVVANLQRSWATKEWFLASVEVHREV